MEIAEAWVHDHARLLVDEDDILVLVHDVQRNVLRNDLELRRRVGKHDGYHIQGLHPIIGLHGVAVDQYALGVRRILDAVARDIGHAVDKVFVDSDEGMALLYREAEMFMELPVIAEGRAVILPLLHIQIVRDEVIVDHLKRLSVSALVSSGSSGL